MDFLNIKITNIYLLLEKVKDKRLKKIKRTDYLIKAKYELMQLRNKILELKEDLEKENI